MSDSDTDKTIDSDELEELIAEMKREKTSPHAKKSTKDASKQLRNEAERECFSKQRKKLHDLSDSDSDIELFDDKKDSLSIKTKVDKKSNFDDKKDFSPKKTKVDKKSSFDDKKDLSPKKTKLDNKSNKSRPMCKYGEKCYRSNPEHLKAFAHTVTAIKDKLCNSESPQAKRKKLAVENEVSNSTDRKLFSFYVTSVCGISSKFNSQISLSIKDLLSVSRGKLKASAQFNYLFDIPWLMQQYPEEFRKCPLTIVHGEQRGSKTALEKSGAKYSNIKFSQAKLEIPFGTHHTKMMLLLYEEGLRIIIHTSNLVESDWFQRTQGMWVSPLFPLLKGEPSLTEGESSTKFKADLIEYISVYASKELEEWCQIIKKHDLSQAKVFVIGSAPGRHLGSRKTSFGHLKLRKVLNKSGPTKELVSTRWPVIGQFSSIGSLGATSDLWLCKEWLSSLATVQGSSPMMSSSSLKLVYPCEENVRTCLEGYPAGVSLPYSYKVAAKQPYLKSFLHQWKSKNIGRSEASPHIKTYLRLSPDNTKIAWFLVTSANLSKAAWGALEKKDSQLMIRSYELGVLYTPLNFGPNEVFSVPNSALDDQLISFPVPYDIPLTPYSSTDVPWIWDIPHIRAPDRNGNMWCPS